MSDSSIVAALEAERTGYVARGDTDRAKQVDVELARLRRADAAPDMPQARQAPPTETVKQKRSR